MGMVGGGHSGGELLTRRWVEVGGRVRVEAGLLPRKTPEQSSVCPPTHACRLSAHLPNYAPLKCTHIQAASTHTHTHSYTSTYTHKVTDARISIHAWLPLSNIHKHTWRVQGTFSNLEGDGFSVIFFGACLRSRDL